MMADDDDGCIVMLSILEAYYSGRSSLIFAIRMLVIMI